MKMRYPQHEFVLKIYDVDGTDTLAPTPFGGYRSNMTLIHGLQQYFYKTPDYEKLQ